MKHYYNHETAGLFGARWNTVSSRHQPLSTLWRRLIATKRSIHIFAVIIIAVFFIHAFHLNVVAEDAFITFQFARHLANGQGIVWNVGEVPVEGYTNFLWLLLSAFLIKNGLNVTLFTQLFGVLASLLTMGYTYRLGRNILHLPSRFALIPCLFLATSGPFAAWATSGMETNLFGMFLVVGCYYYASWMQSDSDKKLVVCFLMLLLGTLTRPEGFIIFSLVALFGAAFTLSRSQGAWIRYVLALSVYLIPFLIYFIWRYTYFGFLLPNTFYAKTGGGFYQYLRGIKYSGFFAFHFLLPLLPIFFTYVWENGFGWAHRILQGQSIARHLKNYLTIYLCLLVIMIYTLYVVYVGGDYMAMYRFFVPTLPFFYMLIGPATYRLFKGSNGIGHKRALTSGLIAFAISMTILQSTPIEGSLFRKPNFMHGTYQGIQYERWHVARYKVIADFFREYKRGTQDSLALGPIGVISYYSDMNIYSIFGIVDPYIAHKPMIGIGQGFAGHEKHDIPYVLSKKPTYFLFSLDLRSEPGTYPDYSEDVGRLIRENYHLKSVWLDDRINDESGYLTFLELKTHEP